MSNAVNGTNETLRPAGPAVGRPQALRVLQVSQQIRETGSGVGVYSERVLEALVAHGVDVHYLQLSPSLGAEDVARLNESMSRLDPHVLHVLQYRPRHLLRLSRLAASRPLVVTVHNVPPQECRVRFWYGTEWLHLFARNLRYLPIAVSVRVSLRLGAPDAVVCASDALRRRLIGILGRENNLFICPLGRSRAPSPGTVTGATRAPHHASGASERPRRIVTVGAFIFHKGIHRLIPIMANLKRDGIACRLDVLGRRRDAGYVDHVTRLIHRYGVAERVTLVPDATEAAIGEALDNADLYVQPSLEEGFCITFLDAALSVPRVVGTDVGAIPEIVALRGDTASCVPRGSRDALEEAIRRHLEQPPHPVPERIRQCLTARYSWSGAAARLRRIYQLVATTGRHA